MTSPSVTAAEIAGYAPPAAAQVADLAPPVADVVSCPECGAGIAELFCGRCGEGRPDGGALRLRHLVGELVEHVTSLDFRLVRTFVTLVRHPGQLTRDFVAGRRGRYTRPLALYLLVSGAFFLITPHLPVRPMNPRTFIDNANPAPALQRHFEAAAARHGETRTQLAERVGRSPFVGSRYAAALLVPGIAAVLTLLLARRRRLLAEHVLFAIHLETFLLVAVALVFGSAWPVGRISGIIGRAVGVQHPSDLLASLMAGTLAVAAVAFIVGHVYVALRRVYVLRAWQAAWRAAAIFAALPFLFYFGQFALAELVAQTGLR